MALVRPKNVPVTNLSGVLTNTQLPTLDYTKLPANVPMISMRLTSSKGTGLIAWDSTIVQQGITYSSLTKRFTVPRAGKYKINFNGFKGAAYGLGRLAVGLNSDSPTSSSNIGHIYSDEASAYDTLVTEVIVTLAANDYFTFCMLEGGLYSASNDQFNFMTANYLGA